MAGPFASTSVRGYGKVNPSWWNALRSAGILLENLLGPALISQTTFTFANNQSTANVTGLIFDSSTSKSARAWVSVRRKTSSSKAYCETELWLSYDAALSSWVLQDVVKHGLQDDGITWTVTSGGQVQYATDSMSGSSYTGVSCFSAMTAT